MACPRLDHFGLSVGAESELDDILARAKAWQARDDRVDIIDKKVDDHGMLAITSIYVRYLLPMMVEIQWWDYKRAERDGAAPRDANRRCDTARSRRRAGSSSTPAGRRPTRGSARRSSRSSTEQLGYDHLWVYDHVETVPRREPTHVFEAFTTLAALAQHTHDDQARPARHVRGVPQRRPARQGSRVRRRVLRRPADPRDRRGLVRARVPGVRLSRSRARGRGCRSSTRRSRS